MLEGHPATENTVTRSILIPTLAMLAMGCGKTEDGGTAGDALGTEPSCDESADADGDGLNDCEEEALGLDPAKDDTDGDGLTDLEEVDCGTSALDANDTCYACGWGRNDPGTIQSTGADVGDVMANVGLTDQCGEVVNMYDFAGAYHVMYMTTAG